MPATGDSLGEQCLACMCIAERERFIKIDLNLKKNDVFSEIFATFAFTL